MYEVKLFEEDRLGIKINSLVDEEGNIWFIGKEVAEIFGYKNSRKALGDHVDEEEKVILKSDILNNLFASNKTLRTNFTNYKKIRELILITEDGFYCLAIKSKMPNAIKFRKWVTKEVLPSLRKNNYYIDKENINQKQLDSLQKELEEVKDKYLMYRNEDYYNIFEMREMLNYTSNEFPCHTDKLRSKSIEMGFPIKQEEIYCYGSYNYYNRYHFMVWEEVYKNIRFTNEDKERVRETYEKLIS